jgi:hypothetical protein
MPLQPKTPGTSPRGQKTYKRTPLRAYYRASGQSSTGSPFKKKQPQRKYRKVIFGVADVILINLLFAGLIYSLLLRPQPTILSTSWLYHPPAVYSSRINSVFGGIKNSNKITFDEQTTGAAIQKQFPEVQSVRIELPFFSQQPKVRLNISPPAFKLLSGNSLYIIDSQGRAVAPAADLPKLKKLVVLNDQSGYKAVLGQQILSSQAVDFIKTLIAQANHNKVPISSLTLPALAQELDLRTADQPYFVKFYLGGDADTQVGQFIATRQKLAQIHQTPGQYLDVRVPGKIFYK